MMDAIGKEEMRASEFAGEVLYGLPGDVFGSLGVVMALHRGPSALELTANQHRPIDSRGLVAMTTRPGQALGQWSLMDRGRHVPGSATYLIAQKPLPHHCPCSSLWNSVIVIGHHSETNAGLQIS
jgi:hypothetical protein